MEKKYEGKTVAFCTSSMTIRLSRDIWAGIQQVCKQQGINTICYTGELIYPSDYETNQSGANIVYEFIDLETIDGVILYTADICELVDNTRMKELADTFDDIPVVSISWEIPNIPTITIDNYNGMTSLIEHLIEEHSYQNIAFVQGPKDNPEAIERYNAYLDVLQKYDIPFNEQLVCPGEFSRKSGHEAVETLWGRQEVKVDVIVCVDDETAWGVSSALQSMNIKIPEDVAVTGFDNEDMSGVMSSPLTTVEQPLFREGELALHALLQMWDGEDPGQLLSTPTELIIRSSCGCEERLYNGVMEQDVVPSSFGIEQTLHTVRDELVHIVRDISISQDLGISKESTLKMVDLLISAHELRNDKEFSSFLWHILIEISTRGEFISPIQEVFNKFHQLALTTLDSNAVVHFENTLHRARIMIGSVAERVNSFLRIDAVEKLINLGDVNYVLNAHFTRENLNTYFSDIADGNFDRLGITSFYLLLYKDGEKPLEDSRLLFAWENGISLENGSEEVVFPTKKLLPQKYSDRLRTKNLTVCPLFFNTDQYGFIIAETMPREAMASDILSWQISSAFNRVDLIQREEQRRVELEQSLAQLQSTQRQLVEAEKMASLGNLVAGIAHEINTPIGAGVTYASYFQEIVEEMNSKFAEGTVTKSSFVDFLEKGSEVSRGLMINLNRAAELVRSFKEIAVDQTHLEKRNFNLKEYIEEILISLKKLISQAGHTISLNCPDDLTIESYPGQISQVLLNLIMNSLTHAFSDDDEGELLIDISVENEDIIIVYSDNGKGVSEKVKKQIFDPFFTTKRNEGGSGLGMNIVYNLVTQSLGGNITCVSSEGEGIAFHITIPKIISDS